MNQQNKIDNNLVVVIYRARIPAIKYSRNIGKINIIKYYGKTEATSKTI